MPTLRPANERGQTKLDWLNSWHTFSFDQYFDPHYMGFGPLRVINEDIIAPGGGFGTHSHRNMEIITYIIDGQLRHQDSMGNGSIISSGEIQKMSAGTGVSHSEYNASNERPVHLLQIWIEPNKLNIQPSYEQQKFALIPGEWKLLAGANGDALISIQQNANLYALSCAENSSADFKPKPNSKIWIQVVKGICSITGNDLKAGDGLALDDDLPIKITTKQWTEILLFEQINCV